MAWCCCPFRDAFGFNFSSNRETKIADVFHSDRSGVRRSTLRRREGPGLQLTSEAAPLGGGVETERPDSGRILGDVTRGLPAAVSGLGRAAGETRGAVVPGWGRGTRRPSHNLCPGVGVGGGGTDQAGFEPAGAQKLGEGGWLCRELLEKQFPAGFVENLWCDLGLEVWVPALSLRLTQAVRRSGRPFEDCWEKFPSREPTEIPDTAFGQLWFLQGSPLHPCSCP